MNNVLGHNSTPLYWTGAIWANKMNFSMNHASGAGLITELLTSSPMQYHYATAVPIFKTTCPSRSKDGSLDSISPYG